MTIKEKILSVCIVTLGILFVADKVNAESTFVGVSYGTTNTSKVDFTTIDCIIGHQFNEFLGIEGRASCSSSMESYGEYSVEIDSKIGLYISAAIPVEENTNAYVMFGHTEGDIAFNSGGDSYTHKIASSSLGFGIRHFVLERYTIFFEYLEIADEEETVIGGIRLNF